MVKRFDRLRQARKEVIVRDHVLNVVVQSINEITVPLTTAFLLIFAAGMMRAGSFTVGDFALFVSYVSIGGINEYVSLDRIFELVSTTERDALGATDSFQLRTELPTFESSAPLSHADDHLQELRVTGLTYRYPDSGRGIEDIGFSLQEGMFMVV